RASAALWATVASWSAGRQRRRRVGARVARISRVGCCLLLLLAAGSPQRAAASVSVRRAVLILCDGMDAGRFLQQLGMPAYASLPRGSAAGLLNVATRPPRGVLAAYLTLGAGERLGAVDTAEPVLRADYPYEGGAAAQVYARRVGPAPPGAGALHLGWA